MDSLNSSDFLLVAQEVTCAYPVSDIYAPTPRILFYALIAAIFLSPRQSWLARIFLGAAVTYAASAAINAFIIAANPSRDQAAQAVSIPFISPNGSYPVQPVVSGVEQVLVQPDAVELDLDTITAIVVTAYLVGLPLQAWSRTARSSRVVHYMILLWNAVMLAATVCVLVSWPDTNYAPTQYRFCYSGFLDPSPQQSNGGRIEFWQGSWNSTVSYVFENPLTVWQNLTEDCIYPCFTTKQILRQSTSLRASVATEGSRFAKLHNPDKFRNDYFSPWIYSAIFIFAAAQLFLLLVARLRLCSSFVPIYEPSRLWRDRKSIFRNCMQGIRDSVRTFRGVHVWIAHTARHVLRRRTDALEPSMTAKDLLRPLRLCLDGWTIILLTASLTLFPIVVIGFICWIEWYIRNDGSPNERAQQVGQWSPPVSLAVVVVARLLYSLKDYLASKDELMSDIEKTSEHLSKLKKRLGDKNQATQ